MMVSTRKIMTKYNIHMVAFIEFTPYNEAFINILAKELMESLLYNGTIDKSMSSRYHRETNGHATCLNVDILPYNFTPLSVAHDLS